MRANGVTLQLLAAHFNVTTDTVQRAVDPEYAERRKQLNNEARRRRRGKTVELEIHRVDARPSPAEAAAAIASVPKDTRDLTARMLGDPLPGRSALAKKGTPV